MTQQITQKNLLEAIFDAALFGLCLLLGLWGLASLAQATARAQTTPPASAPENPWGETLNGMRMRVTAPSAGPDGVVEYRRGRMVPLDLEIENVGPDPIPLKTIHAPSFKIMDLRGNRIGVQGYLLSHIPPWQMASGDLAPGQGIRDRVYLERLHWRLPDGADRKINLLFQLPTPKSVPNQLSINADANPVTVMMIDSPFDHPLKSSDLPDSWTKDLEIEYVESGFFFGSLQVRIDGTGRVTANGARLRDDSTLGNGRFEFQLTPAQSDEWVRLLKGFWIERLNPYDGKRYASDLVQIHLCIALGGNTLVGQYEDHGLETPEVVAFRELINTMLAKLKPSEKLSNK
jgi:hypothetical protein